MIEIIDTQYLPSETRKVFTERNMCELISLGFIVAREPHFEEEPYVMSLPSKVIVKYDWYGEEKIADLKYEIKRAYNRYNEVHGKNLIKNFTIKTYETFLEDLNAGRAKAYPSKFKGNDIWFKIED